jgi:hypothetical protein
LVYGQVRRCARRLLWCGTGTDGVLPLRLAETAAGRRSGAVRIGGQEPAAAGAPACTRRPYGPYWTCCGDDPPASQRAVYLCLTPCDMRKSFDSLYALVRDHLELDALAGHLLVSGTDLSTAKGRNGTVNSELPMVSWIHRLQRGVGPWCRDSTAGRVCASQWLAHTHEQAPEHLSRRSARR